MSGTRVEERSESGESLVRVRAGGVELGLWISRVREVLRPPPITRVPEMPPAVLGVTSVRGEIVPVIDLGLRLGESSASGDLRLVLLRPAEGGEAIGLLVDEVLGLVEVHGGVEPAPEEARTSLPPGFVAGVARSEADTAITVLDLDAVLDMEQTQGEGR